MFRHWKGFSSSNFIRLVEEKGQLGLWSWDFATDDIRWSFGLYQIIGVDPADTKPDLDLLRSLTHPDDRRDPDVLRELFALGRGIDRNFRIIRSDGKLRWLMSRAELVHAPDGAQVGAAGMVVDITEHQHAVQLKVLYEQRFRAMAETLADATWTYNPLRDIYEQEKWCALTGQTVAEARGSGWLDAVHGDDRRRVRAVWEGALASRSSFRTTCRICLHDGRYQLFQIDGSFLGQQSAENAEWIIMLRESHTGLSGTKPFRGSSTFSTAQQIKAARACVGWNVQQLAAASGLSVSTVRRMEDDDRRSLRTSNIDAIMNAFAGKGVNLMTVDDGFMIGTSPGS